MLFLMMHIKHTHTIQISTSDGSSKTVVESDDSWLQDADEMAGDILDAGAELLEEGVDFLGSIWDSD